MSLFSEAQQVIAGGVNSPVRAFTGVGGEPVFFASAQGAWLEAEDGKRYIDYVGSWGPMILGHGHPAVIDAVVTTAQRGLSFGAPCTLETRLAEKIRALMPSLQRMRMVSSGTEATMSAIRLARGHTGRDKIIKFEGCYHGHSDSLLIKAGSGALTLGVPSSPGVPAALAEHTITLSFNDSAAVVAAFAELGEQIACVIVEPIAGNMNMVPPVAGFLETLRDECTKAGAILILDEVMTGFRVAKGGAQALFGIEPDLTTLGKIVGGGMPAAAFGGRADIMASIAPQGPVYQAGTLSGNPVAMAAGLATLEALDGAGLLRGAGRSHAAARGRARRGRRRCGHRRRRGVRGWHVRPRFHRRRSGTQLCTGRRVGYGPLQEIFPRHAREGIYLAPSAFEAGFVSAAHGDDEISRTLEAARKVFATL